MQPFYYYLCRSIHQRRLSRKGICGKLIIFSMENFGNKTKTSYLCNVASGSSWAVGYDTYDQDVFSASVLMVTNFATSHTQRQMTTRRLHSTFTAYAIAAYTYTRWRRHTELSILGWKALRRPVTRGWTKGSDLRLFRAYSHNRNSNFFFY